MKDQNTNILAKRPGQLTEILKTWNGFESENRKELINIVMGFVESASIIAKITQDKELEGQLKSFSENYQTDFRKNITKLGKSDFSQESMEFLKKIKAIENGDESFYEKRGKVSQIEGFSEQRKKLIDEGDNKYQHAQARVCFNYGTILDDVLVKSKKQSLPVRREELVKITNENEFFKALVGINKEVDIAGNFAHIGTRDGMEEHDLINQASRHRQLLDPASLIRRITGVDKKEFSDQVTEFFQEYLSTKSFRMKPEPNESQNLVVPTSSKKIQSEGRTIKVTYGYEQEFLLEAANGGSEAEKERLKNLSDFTKLVYSTADLDSRIKMRENYEYPVDNLGPTVNPLLLFDETELDNFKKIHKGKYGLQMREGSKVDVRNKIENFLRKDEVKILQNVNEALTNIALLSQEELMFFDLFFLRNDDAKKHKVDMDGVFDHNKTLNENLNPVLEAIATKASFYSKTLDMIRAHEVSFGPFEANELGKQKEASNFMRRVAAEHNLRMKDRDVQINIGASVDDQSILKIETRDIEGGKEVVISQGCVDVLNALKLGLQKAIEANPWIAREGQSEIEVYVDRKKGGLKEELEKTPYFKTRNKEDENDVSAFPTHRYNTGKHSMMRLANISKDLGVVEIRLIGNNTHVPNFSEYTRDVCNGFEELPNVILPFLQKEIDDLNITNEKITNQVVVNHDGSILGVDLVKLDILKQTEQQPSIAPRKKRKMANEEEVGGSMPKFKCPKSAVQKAEGGNVAGQSSSSSRDR